MMNFLDCGLWLCCVEIQSTEELLYWGKMVFLLWFMFYFTLCPLFSKTNSEQIHSLPGQPKNLILKQYSGYIVTDESRGRSSFYYFVEAQSKRSPALVPLTLWLGGAHGCSSVGKALFTENGPFRPGKDGMLKRNACSWNLAESNMLYVDSPIGTGFSFSKTRSDYNGWNATMTVNENMRFLVKWFEKFPKYRNSDFYLGGDGLIGHLVPQLATLVLEYNESNVTPINLKGLAIGNLGRGPYKYTDDYLWYHGVISQELYTKLKTICSSEKAYDEIHRGNTSKDCEKIMSELDKEIGEDVDMDSLLMPICVPSNSSLKHHVASEDIIGDPCLYDNTMVYLNRPEVQKALHINKTQHWDECRGGDQDMTYPVVETRGLAHMLAKDLKLVRLRKNEPWYNGPQVGGWSESYGNLREGKNFTYLTFASVKGGSHFAPSSNPSEVFTLFKSFLKGSPPKGAL
ncbi:hypothetical protein DM860_006193 [Cuscuta australis]|uniref:Uncharacterized protein n=1 Tax=Cuscuta australis TaxID=267555 RepID=A0A328DNZ9_9ASTE|nr:hypothetical protein DM860_006193 [Cuscuta australis]